MTNKQRPDVIALLTSKYTVERDDGQMFYETAKTWQLWQETPRLQFISRWNKRNVFCTFTQEDK